MATDDQPVHTIDTLLRLAAQPFPTSTPNPDPSTHPLFHPTALPSHFHLAPEADANGYTLLHACASYNHVCLLQILTEPPYNVAPNQTDEDGETALFAAETRECARVLVEVCGVNPEIENDEEISAEESREREAEELERDGENTVGLRGVVAYLRSLRGADTIDASDSGSSSGSATALPPNIQMSVQAGKRPAERDANGQSGQEQEPDPEFKRRIEELAARGDFGTEEGQSEFRRLVADVVGDLEGEEREALDAANKRSRVN